jgi:membrane-associated phospholipid phosphatase
VPLLLRPLVGMHWWAKLGAGSRLWWAAFPSFACLAGMVVLGLAVRHDVPPIDVTLLALLALPPDSWLMVAVTAINVVAGFPTWDLVVLVSALAVRLRGRGREALFVALSLSGDVAVASFKAFFNRPRPSPSVSDLIATSSYPSGHVARMVITLGVMVALLAWRHQELRVPTLMASAAAVALVAVCRVASGEHWPTDVLGGLLLGIFWLDFLLTAWLVTGRR